MKQHTIVSGIFRFISLILLPVTAVFPSYALDTEPEKPLPGQWKGACNDNSAAEIGEEWWKMFNDATLDSLEAIALENSYDLAATARRIKIAQAQLQNARAGYFPNIGVSAGWTKQQNSGLTGRIDGKAETVSFFDAGITASWEVDVFGKIYSQAKEQKANIKLSRAEYAGAILSVTANVAASYFQLRVWQEELIVANEHAVRQGKVMKIAEARFEAGIASMLDVAQARGVYYSTRASVPVLENSISTAINSLAVLLGVYPESISDMLLTGVKLPSYMQMVATGYPADILNRRPDIAQARMQIEANAAALGVAKKAYLPSLVIDGSVGTSAHSAGDLFGKQSFTYSVAPRLSWTIFEGGARNAQSRIARENMRISVDNYNAAVMTAVEEVQTAITSYHNSLRHIEAIEKVIEQSDEAYRLSLDLYKRGLTPFNNVVTAQMDMLENRNTHIIAHGQALTDVVNLCKALGGGWTGL